MKGKININKRPAKQQPSFGCEKFAQIGKSYSVSGSGCPQEGGRSKAEGQLLRITSHVFLPRRLGVLMIPEY